MIIPCQTFLLTLQEADNFLPQLLESSLNFQILDPKMLGESWETDEINYSFRNWQNKIEIIDKVLGKNNKNWQNKWQKWQKYFGEKPGFKSGKNNLQKNLEIAILYCNYKEILNLIAEVELVKINLEAKNKTDIFFGRDIEEFTLDFVSFAKNVVAKVNNQSKINLIEKPLIDNVFCQNLIEENLETKKIKENSKTNSKTKISQDLEKTFNNENQAEQIFQPNYKQNSEQKTNSKLEFEKINKQKSEEKSEEEIEKNKNQTQIENEHWNENLKKWQVLFCPQDLSQDLVIFAKRKNADLLDFEEIKITLEKEKFALEKKLKILDFEPKMELAKSQIKIFEKTKFNLKIEQKMNYYRFLTAKNIPANYKKSQIIITNPNKSQKLSKIEETKNQNQKPELSFVIIAFPENQLKLFFDKIKPFKIAFAQINNENLVFWQTNSNSIDDFVFKLINFQFKFQFKLPAFFEKISSKNLQRNNPQKEANIKQIAPENNSKDPSFIFLNFLIFNLAMTLGNFDTGFYLLICSILLFFWIRSLAIFTFLTAILTIFFGLLFGNFGFLITNLTNFFKINLDFLTSFQIISFNSISKAPINQFFGLISPWQLAVLTLIFFILIGVFQILIVQFLSKRLNLEQNSWQNIEQTNSTKNKSHKTSNPNQIWHKSKYFYFILYILLGSVFGSQFYVNFWLNSLISQNIFWVFFSPFFTFIQFILAFLTSFLITKYFLLEEFYKPTAQLLKPEKDTF